MKLLVKLSVMTAFLLLSGALAQAQTNVLSVGHTDLALDYTSTNDTWNLHVASDTFGTEYAANEVILQVKGEAKTTVPLGPNFSFLGNAGDPIWILPQTQDPNLLYLGYGGDGIPDGVFLGNQVTVTLKSVSGPGDFFSYKTDTFGNPVVYFGTHDGISSNDMVTVQAGGDAHLNWAFTAAGTYSVAIEATGTLVNGNKVTSSGPVVYTFSVLAPIAQLTDEHADIQVLYDSIGTNGLSIAVRDVDHNVDYKSNEVYLVVKESSQLTLPAGTPFGNAGDILWIIPQSQNPDLLYLGLSAEGIAGNIFSGNFNFQLKALDGPGNMFVWQSDSSGNLHVYFNAADGITDADSHSSIVGSHEHFNWGFTINGVYEVTFQVSGQRFGETTNIVSPLTTFTFEVLPLPTNAPPTTIQLSSPKLLSDASFAFSLSGAVNRACEIQTTADFVGWNTVTNIVPITSPQTVTVPADAGKSQWFFRVQAK
jgi:surface-anchored protein